MGKQICFTVVWGCEAILPSSLRFEPRRTSNAPFPEFKTTRDKKHDQETYIEDLIDYCIMQNWYETSKEGEAAKWTKSDKAMACLRASLSPAVGTVYKNIVWVGHRQPKLQL